MGRHCGHRAGGGNFTKPLSERKARVLSREVAAAHQEQKRRGESVPVEIQPKVIEKPVRYAAVRVRGRRGYHCTECIIGKVAEIVRSRMGRVATVIDDLGIEYRLLLEDGRRFIEEAGHPAFDRSTAIKYELREDDLVVLPKKGDFHKPYYGTAADLLSLGFDIRVKTVTVTE